MFGAIRLAGECSTDSVKCSLLHNCKALVLCCAMWDEMSYFQVFRQSHYYQKLPNNVRLLHIYLWDLIIYLLFFVVLFLLRANSSQTQMLAKLDNSQLRGRKAINQPAIKRAHSQHLMNHHTGRFPNRSVAEYRLQ